MWKKDEICLIFIEYCFILLLYREYMQRILYFCSSSSIFKWYFCQIFGNAESRILSFSYNNYSSGFKCISSIRDLSNGSKVIQNYSIGNINSNTVAFLSLLMNSGSYQILRADADSTKLPLICRADTDPYQTLFGTPLIFSSSEVGKNLI